MQCLFGFAHPFGVRVVLLALLACFVSFAAHADDLPAPTDSVVVTVTGNINQTNTDGAAKLDRAALEWLGTTTFDTSTIWTNGVVRFRGVPLDVFLTRMGAKGSILRIWALNDYSVEIPFSDAVAGGPMLAFEADGKPLSVRDKGPLWLVYPFDSDEKYQTEVIYSRAIWQIDRIEVLD